LRKRKRLQLLLCAALIFSLTGDIFLLLPPEVSWYFIGGLLAFLLAHLMYIAAFFKMKRFRTTRTFLASIFLLFYALVVFKFIGGSLGELYPYVILYMLVLLLMVLTAFVRNHKTTTRNYVLVLTGALLFMVSDTILALNKFYQPFAIADIFIMLTYGWAQFLIIYGASLLKSPSSK
ncbi:MAG: lysoplasmalogenase, partial [Eudoraea sp.]|nr:lysoplasmalogenase [Eudoraea sp.]